MECQCEKVGSSEVRKCPNSNLIQHIFHLGSIEFRIENVAVTAYEHALIAVVFACQP